MERTLLYFPTIENRVDSNNVKIEKEGKIESENTEA